jgi:hypothetical protein
MGNCFAKSYKTLDPILVPHLSNFCQTYLEFNDKRYTPLMDILTAFFVYMREQTRDIPGTKNMDLEKLYLSLTTYLFLHYPTTHMDGFRNKENLYNGLYLSGVSLKMFPRFI